MKIIMFALLVLAEPLSSAYVQSKGRMEWPPVAPMSVELHFSKLHNEGQKVKILGVDGKSLYLLECYLNAYDHDDPNFNYSGAFECRLSPLYTNTVYSTLLTEEKRQSRDWQSRGRFFPQELLGKCAEYPEFGRIRHFRLRAMELTLNVENMTLDRKSGEAGWKTPDIESLDLNVKIVADRTAVSEIAEPAKYMSPAYTKTGDYGSLDCSKVLRRKK